MLSICIVEGTLLSDVFTYWQQQSTPQSPANWATLVAVLQSNYVGEEELSYTIRNTFGM